MTSEDGGYLKVPEGVDLFLEISPHSNSQQWETCRREVDSVLSEIRVKNTGQRPCLVLNIFSEGVYKISPVDCDVDSYSLRERQSLMRTEEKKLADRAILEATGFALPIIITINYKQEKGRLYHSCLRIKEGHIS